jgi:hypothetical protein
VARNDGKSIRARLSRTATLTRTFDFWDRISAPPSQETAMTKRTGFLQLEEIPLNKFGLSIRAYGKKKNYVGRVEVNHAGLAAFTGPKGKKCIANLSWRKYSPR